MKTMIDTPRPEIERPIVHLAETQPASEPREQLVSWLIVGASFLMVYLVFRVVMLELDVHRLLDELLAMTGQPSLLKS